MRSENVINSTHYKERYMTCHNGAKTVLNVEILHDPSSFCYFSLTFASVKNQFWASCQAIQLDFFGLAFGS